MTQADPSTAGTAPPSAVPAVELRGITKRFGAVVACDQVDIELHRGRIHGILGENGAGKSTLMKILIGLVIPDAGSITVHGEPCQINDPVDAARHGIAMVHQHFSLVETLTVWENVALGDSGPLHPASVRDRVAEISEHYGLSIDPDAKVGDLPAGLRQRVEIIKCLRGDPSILIFDEPTSVLTPDESTQLFASLRNVVEREGRAVALVSHKLDEILAATDEVTIMRDGCVVAALATTDADAPGLARAMVGRDVELRGQRVWTSSASDHPGTLPEAVAIAAPPALSVSAATVAGPGGLRLLDGLSLEVAPGEIVGIAGVEGNGQRVLADVLSSLLNLDAGTVSVAGVEVATGRPGSMARAGVGVIPEDRHDSGVVLDLTVAENLVLVDPEAVAHRGVIDPDAMRNRAERLIADFAIMCEGPDAPLWSLSGGNQQRVVLARELSANPKVLVAAQPTRGLDVGAIEYMTGRLRAAAQGGVGVLLISSELEEILDIADRIIVMHRGRAAGEMLRSEADAERIGLLMGGSAA